MYLNTSNADTIHLHCYRKKMLESQKKMRKKIAISKYVSMFEHIT